MPVRISAGRQAAPAFASAVFFIALLAAFLLGRGAGAATPEPEIPASSTGEITRLREVLAAASLSDEDRSAIEALLAQAAADEHAADEALEKTAVIRAEAAHPPAEPKKKPASEDFLAWQARLPSEESLDAMEQRLSDAQAEVGRLRQTLNEANAALTELLTTPATLLADLSVHRRLVDEKKAAAAGARAAVGEDGEIAARARAVAADAALRRALADRAHLEASQDTLPVRQHLLETRRRDSSAQLAVAEQRADFLQGRVRERRSRAVEARRALLLSEQAEYAQAPFAIQRLAAENIGLVEQLIAVNAELATRRRSGEMAARAAADVENALRSTESRLALGGADAALGLILLRERQRLAEPAYLQRQLEEVQRRFASAHLRLMDLSERSGRLDDLPRAIREAMKGSAAEEEGEAEIDTHEAYSRLLRTQATLVPELAAATRQLADALGDEERALRAQLTATGSLMAILDRRLLWIPTHEPIDRNWLFRHPAGWADLLKPSRLVYSAQLLGSAAIEHRVLSLALVALLGIGILLQRRIPARLENWATHAKQIREDRFSHTLKALGASIIGALPPPLIIWGIGWLLQGAGAPGKFTHSLGRAVAGLAPTLFLASFLGWLTREHGLAAAHFRWPRGRREELAALRPWLLGAFAPIQLGINLAFIRELEPARDTAGRDLMIAWCLLSAWLFWRLLAPGAVLTGRAGAENRSLRRSLRIILPLSQLALAGLTCAGYLLTADALAHSMWSTGFVLLGIAMLHGLASRWFLLGERRLALRRYEQRRDSEDGSERTSATGDAMPDVEPEEITLQSVSMHTRRMLRAFTLALLAVGVLWVWSGVLPALDRLDEVVLWQSSAIGANGQSVDMITLKNVLIGLSVLLLTSVAARNLPGLMEIGLLARIHLDAPTRYAATSLSRYVIVATGIITGLGLIGVRWSQLQWLAAALTVGLGFGLQEIFANFVSGIILLFERPFRVGDVITIADLTGTVTRIRTRATTLVDFDNKEIVIPNKSFITDRLVNWTLTDTRTRIIIKVGVAYGTDPALVNQLLQQVAAEHSLVLDDPPPCSWFMSFGASTLDFELRVFVRSIDDRVRVLNDLNERVAKVFTEHNIEIAFPQLDLRVRELPGGEAAAEQESANRLLARTVRSTRT